ncbi:MAG: adenylate/guanylate cyclase domain-containing protein [Oligoflexales bacterium]
MEFSDLDKEKIDATLLEGVCSRAAFLCMLFSVGFTLYGYSSLEFLQLFRPQLTLAENTWPRFLLNGIPFALLSTYLWKSKKNTKVKARVAAVVMPALFVTACFIHAWPIIWSGDTGLFLYVHGANIFVIAMMVMVISPPKKILFAVYGTLLFTFLVPIAYMLYRADSIVLLKTFLNDMLLFNGASCIAALNIHKLRRQVAMLDAQIKMTVKPFLGADVTRAIYENRMDLLEAREASGLILFADIRGFTLFTRQYSKDITTEFMHEYHSYFAKVIGTHMGHIHKTNGDGHMASFGIMDSSDDLSDIEEFNRTEIEESEARRKASLLTSSLKVFDLIANHLESLRQKYGIDLDMRLGAGLSYGKVNVIVRGDQSTRQEQDLDGEVIIRCARLESYTKLLQRDESSRHSYAVISPEFEDIRDSIAVDLDSISTQGGGKQVRDFPEIQQVLVYGVELPLVSKFHQVS